MATDATTKRDEVPGHADYRIVATSASEDACQCECGWRSEGYHDMTSYAYHEWLAHVAAMRAAAP